MSKKQTALEFLDSKKGKKLLKKNLNAAKKEDYNKLRRITKNYGLLT